MRCSLCLCYTLFVIVNNILILSMVLAYGSVLNKPFNGFFHVYLSVICTHELFIWLRGWKMFFLLICFKSSNWNGDILFLKLNFYAFYVSGKFISYPAIWKFAITLKGFEIIPLPLMSTLFTSTLLLFHSHIVLYCFWCCICIIWLIPLMVCIQSSAKPWQFAHLLTGRTKTNGF